ncbi:uncharacterized protein [Haliotis cracherodii]|uniref:uncharacterized protein n=1 Tax=Haliotis cracherodii TaxID=6455 RepID=UPI0039E73D8D
MLLITLFLLPIFTSPGVSEMIDLPFTDSWGNTIKSEFCMPVTHGVLNWRAHLFFDHPTNNMKFYSGVVVESKDNGKEYVIEHSPRHGELTTGSQYCGHFMVDYTNQKLTSMKFYIEGVNGPTPTPDYHRGHVLWELKSFDPNNYLNHWKALADGQFDEGSGSVVDDPAGGGNKVLRVFYEKGQYVRLHSHRGLGFYAKPTAPQKALTLSYDLFFDPNFDFVKGGKLPGLFGGWVNCSGGTHSDTCFTARLMWRENGDGEIYAYIPSEQVSSFCHDVECNFVYGNSIGRGSWRFQKGKWQTITEHITLNTPGKTDGFAKMWYNGRQVYEINNVNFRNNANIMIDGIFFSTFFGGSTSSWAPTRDCYTYFKNFVLSTENIDPPHIVG